MDVEVLRDGFGEVVEEPAELHRPVARRSICRAPHRWLRPGPQTTTWFRAGGSRGCAAPRALDASAAPAGCVPTLESAASRHAQHHRALGRMQVQTHDVAYLLDEQRIARLLEGLAAMRLQTERTPDAAYRRRCSAHTPWPSSACSNAWHLPGSSPRSAPPPAPRRRPQSCAALPVAARPVSHRSRRAENAAATCRRYRGSCPVRRLPPGRSCRRPFPARSAPARPALEQSWTVSPSAAVVAAEPPDRSGICRV